MTNLDAVSQVISERAKTKPRPRAGYVGRETAGRKVPRTQDEVLVAAIRENCLILRDFSVAAAVGVGSIDDTLLSSGEAYAKRAAFRDLLKQMRFEVQLLIGTRPQNLSTYRDRLESRLDELEGRCAQLRRFKSLLAGYVRRVAELGRSNEADVESYFGLAPSAFKGLPGSAALAMRWLLDVELPRQLAAMDEAGRGAFVRLLEERAQTSLDVLARWQQVIFERDAFLDETLRERYAPVRTFYLVTAHNPRLITKSVRRGPMGEDEFRGARDELARRCAFLIDRVSRMGLPVWRATSEELLLDVSLFYHPSSEDLYRRDLRVERSLATQRASVRTASS